MENLEVNKGQEIAKLTKLHAKATKQHAEEIKKHEEEIKKQEEATTISRFNKNKEVEIINRNFKQELLKNKNLNSTLREQLKKTKKIIETTENSKISNSDLHHQKKTKELKLNEQKNMGILRPSSKSSQNVRKRNSESKSSTTMVVKLKVLPSTKKMKKMIPQPTSGKNVRKRPYDNEPLPRTPDNKPLVSSRTPNDKALVVPSGVVVKMLEYIGAIPLQKKIKKND
jgi:hypothetical protein